MTKQDVERLFTYHSPLPNSTAAMVEVREAAKHLALTMLRHTPTAAPAIETLHVAVMLANTSIIQEQARKAESAAEWLQRRDNYAAVPSAEQVGKLKREFDEATLPTNDGKGYRERG